MPKTHDLSILLRERDTPITYCVSDESWGAVLSQVCDSDSRAMGPFLVFETVDDRSVGVAAEWIDVLRLSGEPRRVRKPRATTDDPLRVTLIGRREPLTLRAPPTDLVFLFSSLRHNEARFLDVADGEGGIVAVHTDRVLLVEASARLIREGEAILDEE